jgi:hypothetical protein
MYPSFRYPLLLALSLSTFFLKADVVLLSGDANDEVHASSGSLADLSSNGDLTLFISGPPTGPGATTPGIDRGGLICASSPVER